MKPLSTKELNYIRDQMSFELLQSKKCREYAEQAMGDHQALFHQIGDLHRQNYESLLGYVQNASPGGVIH